MRNTIQILISLALILGNGTLFAQEKVASMTLAFEQVDSNNVCKALVVSDGNPVKEVAVKLYVERLFGLLPVGEEVSTDESGVATFEFPADIPLNKNGKLVVKAKVEDDENYGSFESTIETNIGVKPDFTKFEKHERSLSASRSRAPYPFIIASLLIISGIWGTLIYVVLQAVKIQKPKKILT